MEPLTLYKRCTHEGSCSCNKTTRAERRRFRRERGVPVTTPIRVVVLKQADNPNPRAA